MTIAPQFDVTEQRARYRLPAGFTDFIFSDRELVSPISTLSISGQYTETMGRWQAPLAFEISALFFRLASQWKIERGASSSITDAVLCPSYQRIIGMGAEAIPLIIRQLQSEGGEPDQWFWALQSLTGADPVPAQVRGDFKAMARYWIEWAVDHGYAW